MHEILTLQLGSASNFIGGHWWNIQESSFIFDKDKTLCDLPHVSRINHQVLFRPGQNFQNQTTFTPRLISVDFRDSVGRDLTGNLYHEPDPKPIPPVSWEGKCIVAPQDESDKTSTNLFLRDLEKEKVSRSRGSVDNKFYNLDSVTKCWTDIVRTPYHPRSVFPIPSIKTEGAVSTFEDGLALFNKGDFVESFEDRIRKFSEEADSLQGFHVLYDVHSLFSGIASWNQEHIADEYSRKSVVSFPVIPESLILETVVQKRIFTWNLAQNLCRIEKDHSLCIPLSLARNIWQPEDCSGFPHLSYRQNLLYHTSAIHAAALETATSSWRLCYESDNLRDVLDQLHSSGTHFANLSTCFPMDIGHGQSLARYCLQLMEHERRIPFSPVSPNCDGCQSSNLALTANRFSLRGMMQIDFNSDLTDTHEFRRLQTPSELLYEFLKRYNTNFSVYVGDEPVHTTTPFPHIFSAEVSECGLLSGGHRPQNTPVRTVPTMTELRSCTTENGILKELEAQLRTTDHRLLNADKEYFEEICMSLSNLLSNP